MENKASVRFHRNNQLRKTRKLKCKTFVQYVNLWLEIIYYLFFPQYCVAIPFLQQ